MNNGGDNSSDQAREQGRREADSDEVSAGTVDIHESETGSDVEVGHTPGKAEGVDAPEAHGNQ
ncbi:MAG: hypothetical protein ACJ73D_06785 [Pyrinomonadaceae bacterium]